MGQRVVPDLVPSGGEQPDRVPISERTRPLAVPVAGTAQFARHGVKDPRHPGPIQHLRPVRAGRNIGVIEREASLTGR